MQITIEMEDFSDEITLIKRGRSLLLKGKKIDFVQGLEPRCCGQTTRLVDEYIQKLFNEGYIEPKDHHRNGENKRANLELTERIRNRLRFEHPMTYSKLKINNKEAMGLVSKNESGQNYIKEYKYELSEK